MTDETDDDDDDDGDDPTVGKYFLVILWHTENEAAALWLPT